MISTYYFGTQPPLFSIALFCPNIVSAISLCIADRLPGKYNGYYYLTDFVILELHNFMCEIVRALIKITPKENGEFSSPFHIGRKIAVGVTDQSKHSAHNHGRANNDRKE